MRIALGRWCIKNQGKEILSCSPFHAARQVPTLPSGSARTLCRSMSPTLIARWSGRRSTPSSRASVVGSTLPSRAAFRGRSQRICGLQFSWLAPRVPACQRCCMPPNSLAPFPLSPPSISAPPLHPRCRPREQAAPAGRHAPLEQDCVCGVCRPWRRAQGAGLQRGAARCAGCLQPARTLGSEQQAVSFRLGGYTVHLAL